MSVLLVTSVLAGLGLGGLGRDAFSDGPDAATIALIDRGRGAERPPVVSVAGTRPRGSTPAQRRTGPAVLWKAYPLDPSTARSP